MKKMYWIVLVLVAFSQSAFANGTLVIKAYKEGTSTQLSVPVYNKGVFLGTTPLTKNSAAGFHQITFGNVPEFIYVQGNQNFSLSDGQVRNVTAYFKSWLGTLRLRAQTSSGGSIRAGVRVNGQDRYTPYDVQLAQGTYYVTFRSLDSQYVLSSGNGSVFVGAGNSVTRTAIFSRVSSPTPTPSPSPAPAPQPTPTTETRLSVSISKAEVKMILGQDDGYRYDKYLRTINLVSNYHDVRQYAPITFSALSNVPNSQFEWFEIEGTREKIYAHSQEFKANSLIFGPGEHEVYVRVRTPGGQSQTRSFRFQVKKFPKLYFPFDGVWKIGSPSYFFGGNLEGHGNLSFFAYDANKIQEPDLGKPIRNPFEMALVIAADDTKSNDTKGRGNFVELVAMESGTKEIQDDSGNYYVAHFYHFQAQKKIPVRVGDIISRGTIIGYCGSTGNSTGPHLHFAIYKATKKGNTYSRVTSVAPMPVFEKPWDLYAVNVTNGTSYNSENFDAGRGGDDKKLFGFIKTSGCTMIPDQKFNMNDMVAAYLPLFCLLSCLYYLRRKRRLLK